MHSTFLPISVLVMLGTISCDGFVTPSTRTHTHRVITRARAAVRTTRMMSIDEQDQSSSFSRGAFLQRGAAAAAAAYTVIGVSFAAPGRTRASYFAGIDVRGIDVSEVLHPGAGDGAGKATKPLRDCVLNVERVRVSTKQLEDDLTNKGAPPGLNGLVKGLIKNYKLDESLRQGAMYIESTADRRMADSAGREALEYLAQTAEYFPAEIDERTGMAKAMNAEALEFTVNALGATRAKLDVYLSKLPSDALQEARAVIRTESGEDS